MACAPKQKPPIEMVIDNALRAMEALEGQIHDLVDRLDPVTNQIPAADGPSNPNEAAGSSKVYNAIDQLDTRIRAANEKLKYVTMSLEV
jgi:hypothetical protein